MNIRSLSTVFLGMTLGAAAWAQTMTTSAPVAASPAAAPASAALPAFAPLPATDNPAPTSAVPDAKIEHNVSEDDHVKIEETRVRGETRKITVQPKIPGMPAYDVVPLQGGLPSSDNQNAGQRVWLNINF